MAVAGTAVETGTVAVGIEVAVWLVVAGPVAAGTAAAGTRPEIGMTTAAISAGTSTGGAVRDGAEPSRRPNSVTLGAGGGLSDWTGAGGIGAAPGAGMILAGM